MRNFHYIARAIIRNQDKILLVKEVGTDYYFLPGGHVEHGEPAQKALERELMEELSLSSQIHGFRGAVENSWHQDDELHCEIGLIFDAELLEIEKGETPKSQEAHIEFEWVSINNLERVNLLPSPAIQIIRKENNAYWASTY